MRLQSLFVPAILSLTLTACTTTRPPDPAAWRPRERWRGFNLEGKAIKGRFSGEWREDDLRMMHELGFNFARIMIDHRYWCRDDDWTQPDPAKFEPIDEIIAWGKKHKIHTQICFSFPPGIDVKTKSKAALFKDPVAQRAMATHWAAFARRYKGIPNDELSFNLFNEPDANGNEANYAPLIEQTTAAIHAEDPTRFVVIDGLNSGRLPELGALNLPVGQSHHAYNPMSISHYKASWLSSALSRCVPSWPPSPATSPLFGSRKPKEIAVPLVLRGIPAGTLTLFTGIFNREVELIVEADGKPIFSRLYRPAPTPSAEHSVTTSSCNDGIWTNLVARPGDEKEWGGELKEALRLDVPACDRLSLRVGRGDWLEICSLELSSGGRTATLPFDSSWQVRTYPELRFAGFGITPAFTLADGRAYSGDIYLDDVFSAVWKPVFDAGRFVMVGEFGAFNKTPHDVTLRWMEANLRLWKEKDIGWALWNFRGAFGILDSGRADVQYEDFHGHKLDRQMLELLQRY